MQPQFYPRAGGFVHRKYWRGAGVVTEQIANLSTRKCRQGSSPCLSALALQSLGNGGHLNI